MIEILRTREEFINTFSEGYVYINPQGYDIYFLDKDFKQFTFFW